MYSLATTAARSASLIRATALNPTKATIINKLGFTRLLSTAFPADRKYKESHEWAKLDDNIATIGISNHAQKELGDIVFVDLPEIGSSTTAAERVATVESVKAAADVYAPVSGEVVEVNEELQDKPELINKAPHDGGWMCKVKVKDLGEMDGLMDSESYEKKLEQDD